MYLICFRRWYISAKQTDQKTWKNLGDKTLMQNLQEYFLQVSWFLYIQSLVSFNLIASFLNIVTTVFHFHFHFRLKNLEVQQRRNILLMDFQRKKEGKRKSTFSFLIEWVCFWLVKLYKIKYQLIFIYRWGFLPVYGDDEYLSICEMPIEEVNLNFKLH